MTDRRTYSLCSPCSGLFALTVFAVVLLASSARSAESEKAESLHAPEATLQGSVGDLRALLPEETRVLLKVSPERMRAGTERLARWFPAETTLYHQNRHPEARLAAAMLDGTPADTFFEDLADEKLPDFSAHTEHAPVFVAVTIPGSEAFLDYARRGMPMLDPANVPGYLHYRLLVPSAEPASLAEAVEDYCGPEEPDIRRMGSCRGRIGERVERGYLVMDTVQSLRFNTVQHEGSLRDRLGYEESSSGADEPTDPFPGEPPLPESTGMEPLGRPGPSGVLARSTPAVRRFVSDHRAFELYARLDDLWAMEATLAGIRPTSQTPLGELEGVSRAPLRAASILAAADPAGREVEDVHVRAGLGPETTVRLWATGTLTELGRRYVTVDDQTPSLPEFDIDGANFSIAWDTGSFDPMSGVEPPAWASPPSKLRQLFGGDESGETRWHPAVRRSSQSEYAAQFLNEPTGPLVTLSQPMGMTAVSRRQRRGPGELFERFRRLETVPVAGRIAGVFQPHPEHDRRSEPMRMFGFTALTPGPDYEPPSTKWLRRIFELGGVDDVEARTSEMGQGTRLDVTAGADYGDIIPDNHGASGDDTDGDQAVAGELSQFVAHLDFESMFGAFLGREPNYRTKSWIRLGRIGELHARAGRAGWELAGVATIGETDGAVDSRLEPAARDASFEPWSASQIAEEFRCGRRWVRNLAYAAGRQWLYKREGLDRMLHLGDGCRARVRDEETSDAETSEERPPAWMKQTIQRWAEVLSREAAALADFEVAAPYARLACGLEESDMCGAAATLTELSDALQLPAPMTSEHVTLRNELVNAVSGGPLPVPVSVTARGLFVGHKRVLSAGEFRRSHIDAGLRETFRRQLNTYVRRHRDAFIRRRIRRNPSSPHMDVDVPVVLAVDRRAPTSASIKLLEMMPHVEQRLVFQKNRSERPTTFGGEFLVDAGRSEAPRKVNVGTQVRTVASPDSRQAVIHLTAEGVDIQVVGGGIPTVEDCPAGEMVTCNRDPEATRLEFMRIGTPGFEPDYYGVDTSEQKVYSLRRQVRERPNFATDDVMATTLSIERSASALGIREATEVLTDWVEKKRKKAREEHSGYGEPSPPLSSMVLIPGPEIPWGVTMRMLTRLYTVPRDAGYGASRSAITLVRPTLDWKRSNGEGDADEEGR